MRTAAAAIPSTKRNGCRWPPPSSHPPSCVAGARDLLAHLRPGQHPVSAIAEAPVAELRLALDPSHVALARGREEVARPPVASNAVTDDALGDDRLRLLAQRPQHIGALRTERSFERAHRLAQAAADLPAVAPARPPSDSGGFQHDHRVSPLREMQGGGDPGEPRADDADVGGFTARERGVSPARRRGGRVPGIGRIHRSGIHPAGPPVGGTRTRTRDTSAISETMSEPRPSGSRASVKPGRRPPRGSGRRRPSGAGTGGLMPDEFAEHPSHLLHP